MVEYSRLDDQGRAGTPGHRYRAFGPLLADIHVGTWQRDGDRILDQRGSAPKGVDRAFEAGVD
jgi:hypothetical protein